MTISPAGRYAATSFAKDDGPASGFVLFMVLG
jgi:hypothetical protein